MRLEYQGQRSNPSTVTVVDLNSKQGIMLKVPTGNVEPNQNTVITFTDDHLSVLCGSNRDEYLCGKFNLPHLNERSEQLLIKVT